MDTIRKIRLWAEWKMNTEEHPEYHRAMDDLISLLNKETDDYFGGLEAEMHEGGGYLGKTE